MLVSGEQGRRAVAFGSLPNAFCDCDHMRATRFAASCRKLQASSLCSPEQNASSRRFGIHRAFND